MNVPFHFAQLTNEELELMYHHIVAYSAAKEDPHTSVTTHALVAACKAEFERREHPLDLIPCEDE